MAKEGQSDLRSFEAISSAVTSASRSGPAPVHLWNPPDCGDIDMRIAGDGTWFYQGTPIGRPALVRLFASVLRRDDERYVLVTPVEKVGIRVDDAPFLAVEMWREPAGGEGSPSVLTFRTNVDDRVVCGPDHALRFEPEPGTGGLKPYLHIRGNLWAKVVRSVFFDLVALGEEREVGGRRMFGVVSGATFFPMAPAEALHDVAP